MNPTMATLWHGYSLASLDRLTIEALRADRWLTTREYDERYAAAWHAIAENIALTAGTASHAELLGAGVRASHVTVRQADQSHGLTRQGATGRNFTHYWDTAAARKLGNPNRAATVQALKQILAALPEPHREALRAYAAVGDKMAAAQMLDLKPGTYNKRLRQARHAAAALWFDGETPPPIGRTRRPGARSGMWKGRPRLSEEQVDDLRSRHYTDGVTYAQLAAETGMNADRLSQLIRGVRSAVPDRVAA